MFDQGGFDGSRRDAVGADVVARPLAGEASGELVDRSFAGAVHGQAVDGYECADGGDEDDAAVARRLEKGVRELAQVEGRLQVGAHHELVVLRRLLHRRLHHRGSGITNLNLKISAFANREEENSSFRSNRSPTRILSFPSKVDLTSSISISRSAGEETSRADPVTLKPADRHCRRDASRSDWLREQVWMTAPSLPNSSTIPRLQNRV